METEKHPNPTWKLLVEKEGYPQGNFPIGYSATLWVTFWSALFPKKGMWYQDCFIKTWGTDYQKKMWQLVAQAIPAEQPVLCHREAKLWRWERPGVPRVTTENKLFEMAQWEEVLKKIPNSNNNNKNVMRRKRQKKTKQLPTVFLIKMLSTVVAIAKHNNRAWTCKFRNIQCIVRHDWTN